MTEALIILIYVAIDMVVFILVAGSMPSLIDNKITDLSWPYKEQFQKEYNEM